MVWPSDEAIAVVRAFKRPPTLAQTLCVVALCVGYAMLFLAFELIPPHVRPAWSVGLTRGLAAIPLLFLLLVVLRAESVVLCLARPATRARATTLGLRGSA